jgi:hypothetical protein
MYNHTLNLSVSLEENLNLITNNNGERVERDIARE